jgi:hypothetical protein
MSVKLSIVDLPEVQENDKAMFYEGILRVFMKASKNLQMFSLTTSVKSPKSLIIKLS